MRLTLAHVISAYVITGDVLCLGLGVSGARVLRTCSARAEANSMKEARVPRDIAVAMLAKVQFFVHDCAFLKTVPSAWMTPCPEPAQQWAQWTPFPYRPSDCQQYPVLGLWPV